MIADDSLLKEFVTESIEHLSGVEGQLLEIEAGGAEIDSDLVNEVFRAVHSIKGAAGFLGLTKVNELSHCLENVLNLIRNLELVPTKTVVDVLLRASDKLLQMVADVENSEEAEVSDVVGELEKIYNREEPADSTDNLDSSSSKDGETIEKDESSATSQPAIASTTSSQPEGPTPKTTAENLAAPSQPPLPKAAANPTTQISTDSNVRVSVSVLDQLMNLAGELVLGRNQLLQSLQAESEKDQLEAVALRIDHVTSELQAAIMKTRMQPVGNVFNRFTRVVRDLSSKLGKSANLTIEGNDVEVDKTIVEAIGDPLTHLIRNSVDHGLETPEQRSQAGKSAEGSIHLRAYHQSGKVRIEITDDGKGINHEVLKEKAIERGLLSREQANGMNEREAVRLIFHPGFSMAKELTDISGRGVGMDVVRSNIEKIGGTVDIETEVGKGTSVIVSLPLTLAIIPSLIVESAGYRFAVPQVNIAELVRVSTEEADERIGKLKNKEVLRLRGSLLPLVDLNQAIGANHSSEASTKSPKSGDGSRNIIVVESGALKYGLVVDNLFDSEEIVVKPLGRHLKNLASLSGATILGDGTVALILDVGGIAQRIDLRISSEVDGDNLLANRAIERGNDALNVLLFSNGNEEQFAIPMESVARIERIKEDQVQLIGGQELMNYRGGTLPLLSLENYIDAKARQNQSRMYVVVFMVGDREIGIIAPELLDIREIPAEFDQSTLNETAVLGTQVVDGNMTRLLNMLAMTRTARPDWFTARRERDAAGLPISGSSNSETPYETEGLKVLLAEDSAFFRTKVENYLREHGISVVVAEDGAEAWNLLDRKGIEFDLVITDLEMPKMNGFELTRTIRSDTRFQHMPIIALTSLAGALDAKRAYQAGVDDYQIKLDHEELVQAIEKLSPVLQ